MRCYEHPSDPENTSENITIAEKSPDSMEGLTEKIIYNPEG
jgi:hypothetical protein